ncbi:MAG: alpha/beta hydrolase [Pseudomonadota bacterium]
MTYFMTVRNITKDKFGSEPGATHFLKVPGNATPSPKHRIRKTDWIKEVMEEATSGIENSEPVGDILFYVHGYNNSPKDVAERHRKLSKGLAKHGFKGVVVSFDWPSANTAINYLEDRHDAKQTMLRLVDQGIRTFAALQRPDCRINQHILAHSMGCYVVREAFDDADDIASVAAKSWTVSQVMFVAGDVSSRGMREGASKSSSLYRHCVRFTNYYNPSDAILKLSNAKRIGVRPRAGRIGLPDRVPEKAVDVFCGQYYKENVDPGLSSPRKAHTWYFEDDVFLRDVTFTIQGDIDRMEIPTREPTNLGNLGLVKPTA